MSNRSAVVAGRFYPLRAAECRRELGACLPEAGELPEIAGRVIGGIGPHAGWVCSGAVMGLTAAVLGRRRDVRSVVMFGAVHVRGVEAAAMYATGAWEMPLGAVEVDEDLAWAISAAGVGVNAAAHQFEHSIEVQVPFVQHYLPGAKIVPIMVPPNDESHEVGVAVARACRDAGGEVVFLGSSDLTHYGPAYDFTPKGVGAAGLGWAKEHNDRRMIDAMLRMDSAGIVPEAEAHWNACGAGAIAATIAACREMGAGEATLLRHTTSYEVLRERMGEPAEDAVGYAGVVFSRPD